MRATMNKNKVKKRPQTANFLLGHFSKYKLIIFGGLAAVLLASTTVLAIGQGLRYVVDQGFSEENYQLLDRGIYALLIVTLALAFASYSRFYLSTWLGERVAADIRAQVYTHVIRLTPNFFETERVGEILSRLSTDTTILNTVITGNVPTAIRNLMMLIGSITLLFITSPKLTGTVLLVIPFVIAPIIFFGKRVKKRSRLAQDNHADVNAFAEESLNAIQIVQSFCREQFESDKFKALTDKAFNSAKSHIRNRAFLTAVVIFLAFGSISIVLWLGGYEVLNDKLTAGQLSSFVFYAALAAASVGGLSEAYGNLQQAKGAAERLCNLLETQPNITAPETSNLLVNSRPENTIIEFSNISFAYPSKPNTLVIKGFSLRIKRGETIAIVGPSGAGKTTLFELLLRFQQHTTGNININEIPIDQLSFNELRSFMRIVPQSPILFSGTIYDNVMFGNLNASAEDFTKAMKDANCDEFVNKLDEKENSLIGEKGIRLSGGQKQRISIARAMIGNPEVLLLDEATSSLDTLSESKIQESLQEFAKHKTVIIIAHRLSTVRNADRIVVLNNGEIVDIGTHTQLMGTSKLYQKLTQTDLNSSTN